MKLERKAVNMLNNEYANYELNCKLQRNLSKTMNFQMYHELNRKFKIIKIK